MTRTMRISRRVKPSCWWARSDIALRHRSGRRRLAARWTHGGRKSGATAAAARRLRPCVWRHVDVLKIATRAAMNQDMTTPRGSTGAVGRAALADERGWALVETLVSAVLLIVIALAITSSLDTASRASAENKQRSVAAALAEQDQERMRGMDASALSNYHPAARNVTTPDGGVYAVTSRSDWIRDST